MMRLGQRRWQIASTCVRLLVPGFGLAIGACGTEGDAGTGRTIELADTQFTLEEPLFVIGVEDAPESQVLHRAGSPQIFGNTVLVANGLHEIRVYNAGGALIRTIGRPGSGPGEFRSLTSFVILRDGRIVTFERDGRRLQLFDSAGSFIRASPYSALIEANTPAAFLPDGRLAAIGAAPPSSFQAIASSVVRYTAPVLLVDGAGTLDTIGSVPGFPWWVTGSSRRSPPVAHQPAIGAGPGFVAYTDGEGYGFTVYTTELGSTETLRLAEEPPALTQDMAALWITERQEGQRAAGMPIQRYPDGWESHLPERLPGYWRLLGGSAACLWAQRYRVPGSGLTRWDVIDVANRRHVGSLVVSAAFTLTHVRGDVVTGVAVDDLGVERVVGSRVTGLNGAGCNR
jgi:hypothetical protein